MRKFNWAYGYYRNRKEILKIKKGLFSDMKFDLESQHA
jgi:hypothetical protein